VNADQSFGRSTGCSARGFGERKARHRDGGWSLPARACASGKARGRDRSKKSAFGTRPLHKSLLWCTNASRSPIQVASPWASAWAGRACGETRAVDNARPEEAIDLDRDVDGWIGALRYAASERVWGAARTEQARLNDLRGFPGRQASGRSPGSTLGNMQENHQCPSCVNSKAFLLEEGVR
jgi:hypothetical protein